MKTLKRQNLETRLPNGERARDRRPADPEMGVSDGTTHVIRTTCSLLTLPFLNLVVFPVESGKQNFAVLLLILRPWRRMSARDGHHIFAIVVKSHYSHSPTRFANLFIINEGSSHSAHEVASLIARCSIRANLGLPLPVMNPRALGTPVSHLTHRVKPPR